TCCHNPLLSFTRFAFFPLTTSTYSSAAAAAITLAASAALARRTVHEAGIMVGFLIVQRAEFAGGAVWNLSTWLGREDAHGRLHACSSRNDGGLWPSLNSRSGFLS